MPPELAELLRWIQKAEHDLQTAEVALDLSRPITDTAGFHCQQAVEKLLKAFLLSKDWDPEKIHDLRALTLRCARFDDGFRGLMEQVAPLTAFAVRYRYPGPNDPTVREANEALTVARTVRDFVLQRLPGEVRGERGRGADALDLD